MPISRNTRKKAKASSNNIYAAKVLYALRMHTGSVKSDVFMFKMQTPLRELFNLFPKIFREENALENLYGPGFPVKLSALFSQQALYKPSDPLTEVVWTICRCLQHGDKLRSFTQLRERYERSIILSSRNDCDAILRAVESQFGYSIWLVQNKLAASLFWDGIEETRKLVRSYEEECKHSWLLSTILWFLSRRVEATGLKGFLKTELSQIFADGIHPEVERYLRAKIFELPNIATDDVAPTLFFEAQACVIDCYETLICVLQSAAVNELIPDVMISDLEKPLSVMSKRTDDCRLHGIMRGMGIVQNDINISSEERSDIIEAYTKGEYKAVSILSVDYLRHSPDDMSIRVMTLKAHVQLGTPYPCNEEGVLRDVFDSLQKVLSASTNTYSAAYDLITLSERFYCHSWIQYLVAVVRNELCQEQAAFPPLQLREIFVRDPYVSPFSAIASNHGAKIQILSSAELERRFPCTRAVYNAVTRGCITESLEVSERRKHKYLAMHQLSFGDPELAISHFKWLIDHSTGSEYLRSSGGAALALLRLGRIREAADAIVLAYVSNENVPSILPIEQITDALQNPADWPDSISIPLIFALHTSYCGGEKLTHLRYAFEVFQGQHNILDPSDCSPLIEVYGRSIIVAYLKRVWTPLVMRQTILFGGMKEIEESRIKVCRLLAELDPPNAAEYRDEIKDRVKHLEIAKGTTLIEQSKVYVEIEAIKKTLRAKLGDSYARYKTSSQNATANPDQLLFKRLTDAMKNIADEKGVPHSLVLSTLHSITSNPASESDAQFDALFAEVTNEFLRGDHGLNSYLSTRVRHGTLSNTLRKAVADERLVTAREEGSATYLRNDFWTDVQKTNHEDAAAWERILGNR